LRFKTYPVHPFRQQGVMAPLEQPSPPATSTSAAEQPSSLFFSQRSQRQLGLFAAGAGFFALSTFITRRSLVRRYKASLPKFYQPSNQPNQVNGAFEALEALNIATINVFSLSMMTVGGFLYAFDISSIDDLRRKVRSRLGVDETRTDHESDEKMEEMLTSILERKFNMEKSAKDIEEIEKKKS
jgi:hypothetical protein